MKCAGSHKLGRVNHESVRDQTGADPERMELILGDSSLGMEIVHCVLPPGGAVFFHCNTLHSSDINYSPSPRWGLIACYNTKRNVSPCPPCTHCISSDLRALLLFRCQGTLKGTGNHPSYDMVGPLEILDDTEVIRMGQRHWELLSGRPAM